MALNDVAGAISVDQLLNYVLRTTFTFLMLHDIATGQRVGG
jgi:hypothetical protein